VWLYRCQVDAEDFRLRMGIGCLRHKYESGQGPGSRTEIHGPDPCTASDVQSSVYVFDWRKVELFVYREPYYVVLEVYASSGYRLQYWQIQLTETLSFLLSSEVVSLSIGHEHQQSLTSSTGSTYSNARS